MGQKLSDEQVVALIDLALKNIDTEFPNKPSHVLSGPNDVRPPKEHFPAFYGCFDWHSSVHGHWMLVRLLKLYPDTIRDQVVRQKLAQHLTKENVEIESRLFAEKENKSFERMYGWAWFLRLVVELESWDDADAGVWRENLKPLEDVLVQNTIAYLPKLSYPIRIGEHSDTGFALGQLLDYAETVNNLELKQLCVSRSRDFYYSDVDYPTRYEPSGHDFFSSCWNEADLMRRVLSAEEYSTWLTNFLPRLDIKEMGNLLLPVQVSDVTDPKLVHLAGLDLSRAWCLNGIAKRLPNEDPRKALLAEAAIEHGRVGMDYVFSGHYEGEHWLATFAVYWLTNVSID